MSEYIKITKQPAIETIMAGVAGGTIPKYYCVRKDSGTGKIVAGVVAEGDPILGVSAKSYIAGEDVTIIRRGETFVLANSQITAGEQVGAIINGTVKRSADINTAGSPPLVGVPIGVAINSTIAHTDEYIVIDLKLSA